MDDRSPIRDPGSDRGGTASSTVTDDVRAGGELDRSQPHQVFVSYNRRDTDAAETVGRALRDRGLSVFVDRWSLPAGVPWIGEIERALDASSTVVIIVGPSGLGDWQQGEADLALDRQRRGEPVRVLPVLLPRSEPPLGFLRLNTWIDLRGGLDEAGLDRLAGAVAGTAEPAAVLVCPYRGLRPFRQEDAAFFFGREEFVERAIPVIGRCTIAAVVGASGSGKSSAVRAGVLPRLAQADPSLRWQVAVLSPGRTPMHALAASLHDIEGPGASDVERLLSIRKLGDALASGELPLEAAIEDLFSRPSAPDRLLLFVDQWEELYTQCQDTALRGRFIDSLLRAIEHPRLGVLLTVRGDFFDDVLEHRELADHLEGGVLNLGPMNVAELRSCMEEPARRVSLHFEEGLVDRILEDVQGEPGSLPLLEFVLQQLWKQRNGDRLVHQAYREMGEVRGAVATHADARLAALDAEDRKRARRVFLQLVQTTPGLTATRRRATRTEIGEDAWPVVLELADARLLVTGRQDATDEETVDVAHEALIRHWGQLREWIDQDREFLLWRRRFGAVLDQHQDDPDDIGTLLRGGPLKEAQGWLAQRADDLFPAERSFIERSAQRAKWVRRRFMAAGAAALMVLAAVGVLAERFMDQRDIARLLHEGRVLRDAADQRDPLVAALLVAALDGRGAHEPPNGARNARRIADRAIPIAALDGGGRGLTAAVLSARGDRVLAGYDDGLVLLWPANDSGPPKRLAGPGSRVRQLAISHDGDRMLALTEEGDLELLGPDGPSSSPPWAMAGAAVPAVVAADFDGMDTAVVAVYADSSIRVWPLEERSPPTTLRVRSGEPGGLAVERGGGRIAVLADSLVEVWDPARPDARLTLRGHTARVVAAAFSPDGATLATASHDGTVRLWHLGTGAGREILSSAGGGAAWSVGFDRSGVHVVAGFDDSTVRVWTAGRVTEYRPPRSADEGPGNATGGAVWATAFHPRLPLLVGGGAHGQAWLSRTDGRELPATLGGHDDDVFIVAFSDDGGRLMTGSRDGEIRIWPGTGRRDPLVMYGTRPPCTAAVAGDGSRVALGCEDGRVRVAATDSLELRFEATMPVTGAGVSALALDRHGSRLAAGSWDGSGVVWDVEDGTVLGALQGHHGAIARLVFDDDALFSASQDRSARRWSGPRFETSTVLGDHQDMVRDVAPAPGGRRIATASADGTVRLWNADSDGGSLTLRLGDDVVQSVIFSPDGRSLIALSDGRSGAWTLDGDPTPLARRIEGTRVTAAGFDERGRRVVTGSADGTTRVWEASGEGDPLFLPAHDGAVRSARFDPSGHLVATAGGDSTAMIDPLDGAEPIVLRHPVATVDDAVFLDRGRILTMTEAGVALWRIDWSALHDYLARSTTACLTVGDRMRFLRESRATATKAFLACERRWGRDPNLGAEENHD